MATYRYKARDNKGELQQGALEASSQQGALEQLKRRQLVTLQLEEDAAAASPMSLNLNVELWPARLKLTDLIVFCRQMYSLMKAGIPIIRAIRGLAESTSSEVMHKQLLQVADELEKGRTLSAAMADHPKDFNRLMISIIHVGENTGRLDLVFLQLTDYFEQELETRKQIKQATRYPLMVLIALAIALVVVNIWVIPQFAGMFQRFHAELPWATQILLGMSSFFLAYWPLLLLFLGGAIAGIWYWLGTSQGGLTWGQYKLKLPVVGDLINRATLGRFSRSLALMLNSGVPLTAALSLVADAVDNDFMGERIREMRRNIERGESLLRVSSQSGLFTPLVLQMLAVGEETGQVDDMLKEVAEFYEREVAYDLKNLTAKLEPILIAIVAGMVLILALGIFLPMWDMLSAYRNGGR
ncbi:MAG TPA: MSHA biogenesis protein MshG [Rheinheimera sp.]|nr:MSHA biogenesis protein MshG [Rheinheimera sp.]